MKRWLLLLLLFCRPLRGAEEGERTPALVLRGSPLPELPQDLWVPGKQLTRAALRGQVIVLYFFLPGSGCGSCDDFVLHLRRLRLRHRRRVTAIGICDAPAAAVEAYAKAIRRSVPLARDPSGQFTRRILGRIRTFPYVAIADTAGRLRWFGRDTHPEQVSQEVARLLGEQPAAPRPEKPGRLYLLTVALTRDPVSGRPLPNPVGDVQAWTRALTRLPPPPRAPTPWVLGHSLVEGLRPPKPDRAPTVANLRTRLKQLASRARAEDQLLLLYSGTAVEIVNTPTVYDLGLVGESAEGFEVLRLSEINTILQTSPARNLLVLDVGHEAAQTAPFSQAPERLANSLDATNVLIACSRGEMAYLGPPPGNGEARRSLFLTALTQALHNEVDSVLTAAELFRTSRDALASWSRRHGRLQVPVFLPARTRQPVALVLRPSKGR